jgi:tRNA pseudouridine38-40 synthase
VRAAYVDSGADRPGGVARWLVRFGYDGSGFYGWARQPGARTVEGVLREGLRRRGIAPVGGDAGLEVASRTDRGVSARANALTLRSELPVTSLLRRLNAISPELFFTAAAPVPSEFRVRGARRRVYRYFDSRPLLDLDRWERGARLFSGPVDARSFGRGLPAKAPLWRTVESVTGETVAAGRAVEVRAPSFVWGMVRKIVGALREVEQGRLSLSRLEAAISGRERLTLPMAEPEGLVLWDVEYAEPGWAAAWSGPNRQQRARLDRARASLRQRAAVVATLLDVGNDPKLAAPGRPGSPPG